MNGNKPTQVIIRTDKRRLDGNEYTYTLSQSGPGGYCISIKMEYGAKKSEASAVLALADPQKAVKFYKKLVRNLATPIDLSYVLEDELA